MIDDASPRPLPVLRAMVDVLDRDLLQIVARRMALVGEIAAYKRQHGLRIRDQQREREILDDRSRRAESMGLPRGAMESVFRVLMRASRDHQATLRAELPYETTSRTIARGELRRAGDQRGKWADYFTTPEQLVAPVRLR